MLRHIAIVFNKELTDSLRDRRTLFGALFYPLLGPVLMVLLLSVILRVFSDQAEQDLALPVIGAEHAPHLIAYLEQNRVAVEPGPADPQAEVRAGDADVVLIIPPGFGADLAAGRPATVQLVFDDTRQSSEPALRRAQDLVGQEQRLAIRSQRHAADVVRPERADRLEPPQGNIDDGQPAAERVGDHQPGTAADEGQ